MIFILKSKKLNKSKSKKTKIKSFNRRFNNSYKPKIKDRKNKPIRYGNKEVRKYLPGGHYHVIVNSTDDEYVSVGLTSDKPNNARNQKLHKVYESNGKIARLKREAVIDDKNKYHQRTAGFTIDTISEIKATRIGNNKLSRRQSN